MGGRRRADASTRARPPLAAGRRLTAAALAALALGAALAAAPPTPAGAADPAADPTATSTTSTTADPAVLPVAPASTTSTTRPSPTTAPPPPAATGAGTGANEPLPPATPGPPPPEEEIVEPPAAVPPVAPPGADEAGRRRAALEIKAAEAALKKGRAEQRRRLLDMVPLQRQMFAAQARMAMLSAQERMLADALGDARRKVRRIAIAGYVHGGDIQPVDFLLRASDPADLERRRTLIATATQSRKTALKGYENVHRGAGAQLDQAVRALDDATETVARGQALVDEAAAAVNLLQLDLDNRRQLLDLAAATAEVPPTDIPRLYLDAYRRAAVTLGKRAPQCRVPWPAVAAIGSIESNHGRYRGAQVALNGDAYPRILGPPLDGSRTALIRDTDLGVLDGDLEFDRAVGPMQFIPSTWARVGEDGNGDGAVDPNNAYDAALATAAYLCRAVPSGGLDTEEPLRQAFFSYNHSTSYVDAVAMLTQQYGQMAAALP